MGDIKDKNGTVIYVGDTVDVGGLHVEIQAFVTTQGGAELMAQTDYGDFNVTIIEKVK